MEWCSRYQARTSGLWVRRVSWATGRVPPAVTVVDDGLGNTCYVLDLGDVRALVDPSRDLRFVQAATEKAGLRIRFVADTHLHADFLSGAVQLAHDDGAQVLASAAGHREFGHRGLVDGDEVDLVDWCLLRWPRLDTPTSTCRRAVRRQLAARRVHRRLPDRRFRCAHGPARGRPSRGTLARAQYRSPAPRHVAEETAAASPRCRFLLLRSAGSRPHLDDRPGAGDEPAAAGARQRRLRRNAAGLLGTTRRTSGVWARSTGEDRGSSIPSSRAARSTTGPGCSTPACPTAQSLSMSGRFPATPPHTSPGPVHPAAPAVRDVAGLAHLERRLADRRS